MADDPKLQTNAIEAADIVEALAASPEARARFAALPPSHGTEYLRWINEAKKAPTRARRAAGMIEKLGAS